VEEHVAEARERGARVHTGGRRREGPGTFYEPTVLSGVTPEMRIWREETFGPVLPVTSFRRDDDAVELANDTRYGLDAYVWTGDRPRGRRVADRLRVGSVMLNDCISNYALPELPFGGVGESGFGRTHGEEGLRAFARPRSEAEPRLKLPREPHWFPGAHRASWARAVIRLLHGDGVRARLSGVWEALRGRHAGPGRGGRDGGGGTLPGEARTTAVGARRRRGGPRRPGDGSDVGEDDRDAGGDG